MGWGNNVRCTCFGIDLLRYATYLLRVNMGMGWGGFGVGCGGVITYVALASSLTCCATYLLRDNLRRGWVGVITYVALASSLAACYITCFVTT